MSEVTDETLDAKAEIAACSAARQLPIALRLNHARLRLFRVKPHISWVYFYQSSMDQPHAVIKVEYDPDGQLHETSTNKVRLIQELGALGAPLERHHIAPCRHDRFTVTITEYLPGSYETSTDLHRIGEALVKLQATPVDSMLDRLPSFDPLRIPRDTFARLTMLRQHHALPRVQGGAVDDVVMARFGQLLQTGEAAAAELAELARQGVQKDVLLHNDITPYNVRTDKNGQPVFIDLDYLSLGPWAYDLARPLGQWARFDRPPQMAASLFEGYKSRATWPIDEYQIELACTIALTRYSTSLLEKVVDAAERGETTSDYLVTESIRRILGEPRWRSGEAYLQDLARLRARSSFQKTEI